MISSYFWIIKILYNPFNNSSFNNDKTFEYPKHKIIINNNDIRFPILLKLVLNPITPDSCSNVFPIIVLLFGAK